MGKKRKKSNNKAIKPRKKDTKMKFKYKHPKLAIALKILLIILVILVVVGAGVGIGLIFGLGKDVFSIDMSDKHWIPIDYEFWH